MKHKKKLLVAGLLALMITPNVFGKSSVLVFISDMYDQRSIKPQEKGSMLEFPLGSVTTKGQTIELPGDLSWMGREYDPATATKNPRPVTPQSLANGELKYNTYCAHCHGAAGDGVSKVNDKGMGAPPIAFMTAGMTDGAIFYKIKDASGAIMPPLGYATTSEERWDIVNYIRQKLEK